MKRTPIIPPEVEAQFNPEQVRLFEEESGKRLTAPGRSRRYDQKVLAFFMQFLAGWKEGWKEGHNDGWEGGHLVGLHEGRIQGRDAGIKEAEAWAETALAKLALRLSLWANAPVAKQAVFLEGFRQGRLMTPLAPCLPQPDPYTDGHKAATASLPDMFQAMTVLAPVAESS